MASGSAFQDSEVPVFYPTLDEFKLGLERYIESVENKVAMAGICKVVPPKGWKPRKDGYRFLNNLTIERPIQQNLSGTKGVYHAVHIEMNDMLLEEFKRMATSRKNNPSLRCALSGERDNQKLEREFWKNITHAPPIYGADTMGSLFDQNVEGWNVAKLDSLLSRKLKEAGLFIPGVNSAYLYFGTWKSMFAWHTEDMDLYSVNYLHFGAPKSWYVIPPSDKERFEEVMKNLHADRYKNCSEYLRHKDVMVSPQFLQAHGINFYRMIQNPGEFVVNYPGAYHAGFNQGYNCAESTNFATKRWIPIGKKAKACSCKPDTVKIQMKIFEDESIDPFLGNNSLESDILPTTSKRALDSDSKQCVQSATCFECGVEKTVPLWLRKHPYSGNFHCSLLQKGESCGLKEGTNAITRESKDIVQLSESEFQKAIKKQKSSHEPLLTATAVNIDLVNLKLKIKLNRPMYDPEKRKISNPCEESSGNLDRSLRRKLEL